MRSQEGGGKADIVNFGFSGTVFLFSYLDKKQL